MVGQALIVDDSAFQRTLLRDILSAEFEVVGEAENGAEAVELFEAEQPGLVTMDIVMPEMTGIEATAEIKSQDPEATVVMCTSVDQEEKMKRAVRAGADGYVTKPLDEAKVTAELESVLDSY
ncbi:response regulator [Halobaculum sp. P14]|uniref:response regulator n=1 Tax=Halobaculum sp. P14 TaxID=3421638 RepID=UPI003EB938F7